MKFFKTKARIENIPVRRIWFVKSKDGKMPKYGHIYNILKFLRFDSATSEQLYRNFPEKPIQLVKKNGFMIEKNGRFYITNSGNDQANKLKSYFAKRV